MNPYNAHNPINPAGRKGNGLKAPFYKGIKTFTTNCHIMTFFAPLRLICYFESVL